MDTQGTKIKVHARVDAVNRRAQPAAWCGATEFVRERAPSP
jgi:hypothetical protein